MYHFPGNLRLQTLSRSRANSQSTIDSNPILNPHTVNVKPPTEDHVQLIENNHNVIPNMHLSKPSSLPYSIDTKPMLTSSISNTTAYPNTSVYANTLNDIELNHYKIENKKTRKSVYTI